MVCCCCNHAVSYKSSFRQSSPPNSSADKLTLVAEWPEHMMLRYDFDKFKGKQEVHPSADPEINASMKGRIVSF